jgi:hypothetical protein
MIQTETGTAWNSQRPKEILTGVELILEKVIAAINTKIRNKPESNWPSFFISDHHFEQNKKRHNPRGDAVIKFSPRTVA